MIEVLLAPCLKYLRLSSAKSQKVQKLMNNEILPPPFEIDALYA